MNYVSIKLFQTCVCVYKVKSNCMENFVLGFHEHIKSFQCLVYNLGNALAVFLTTAQQCLSKGGYSGVAFPDVSSSPFTLTFCHLLCVSCAHGHEFAPEAGQRPRPFHALDTHRCLCLAPDLPREDPPLPRNWPKPTKVWLPVQGAENGIWKDPEHCLLSPVWVVGGDVREGEYPTRHTWDCYGWHRIPCPESPDLSTHEHGFIWE